jgi:hypothetical protein
MNTVGGSDTPEIAASVEAAYGEHIESGPAAKIGTAMGYTVVWGPVVVALAFVAVLLAHALWQLACLGWRIS